MHEPPIEIPPLESLPPEPPPESPARGLWLTTWSRQGQVVIVVREPTELGDEPPRVLLQTTSTEEALAFIGRWIARTGS